MTKKAKTAAHAAYEVISSDAVFFVSLAVLIICL